MSEILKSLHIPFKTKVNVKGREIDFIIGNYAIELDGHPQNSKKNKFLIELGYHPVHFENKDITSPKIKEWIKQLWQVHLSQGYTRQ